MMFVSYGPHHPTNVGVAERYTLQSAKLYYVGSSPTADSNASVAEWFSSWLLPRRRGFDSFQGYV